MAFHHQESLGVTGGPGPVLGAGVTTLGQAVGPAHGPGGAVVAGGRQQACNTLVVLSSPGRALD